MNCDKNEFDIDNIDTSFVTYSFDWFSSEEGVPGWSPAAESELSDSAMMQITRTIDKLGSLA